MPPTLRRGRNRRTFEGTIVPMPAIQNGRIGHLGRQVFHARSSLRVKEKLAREIGEVGAYPVGAGEMAAGDPKLQSPHTVEHRMQRRKAGKEVER